MHVHVHENVYEHDFHGRLPKPRHLATMSVIQLAGVSYTPAALTAVFQADSNAIAAAATGRTQWQQAVATQNATIEVAVLGDFGFSAPKTPGVKTAAAKAASVAKAKATRAARGTKESVQKQSITGNLDTSALVAAIKDPLTSPVDKPEAPAAPPATPDRSFARKRAESRSSGVARALLSSGSGAKLGGDEDDRARPCEERPAARR